MEPRVERYKAAFCHQQHWGGATDLPMFSGASRYQYGQGLGDVLRGIWRFFRPVAVKGAQTLLKAGSEAIKEGADVKDVLRSTLRPTMGVVLGATAEQLANRLTDNKPASAPPPGPALETVGPVTSQTGSGTRKRAYPSSTGTGSRKRSYSLYKSTDGSSFKQPYYSVKREHREPRF